MMPLANAWAITDWSPPMTMTLILSRVGSKPKYSNASMVCDQIPPPMLCTPMRLPFKSSGERIAGATTISPSALLTMPPNIARSMPLAAALSTTAGML